MNKRIAFVFTMAFLVLLAGAFITACRAEPETAAPPTQREETATPTTPPLDTSTPTTDPEEVDTPTTAPEETPPPALDAQAMLQERCVTCHDLGRVERAKKTEEEWRATVERMITLGAQLDQEEKEFLIKYLTETYPQ
ncbi:MAG: hypothetical protein H5T62_16935 [Anaerolineae bacterium]|nr:hypothetical protein [Anaerolineae bacterium]